MIYNFTPVACVFILKDFETNKNIKPVLISEQPNIYFMEKNWAFPFLNVELCCAEVQFATLLFLSKIKKIKWNLTILFDTILKLIFSCGDLKWLKQNNFKSLMIFRCPHGWLSILNNDYKKGERKTKFTFYRIEWLKWSLFMADETEMKRSRVNINRPKLEGIKQKKEVM